MSTLGLSLSFALGATAVLSSTSIAQSFPPTWQANFDGPAHFDDYATSVAVMPSGAVAVAGAAWVEPQPGLFVPQFLTVLYTPQGGEIWSRMHGSGFYGGNGFADQIAITPQGKIVTAGTRDLGADWMVVQYDALGNQEWEGLWLVGSSFVTYLEDIDVDSAGNIYVCADTSSGAGVCKFSSTGVLVWGRAYTGTGQEIGAVDALAISPAGEVFLTGYTGVGASTLFSVARIDPTNGNPIWIQNSGLPNSSFNGGVGLGIDGLGRAVAGGTLEDAGGTSSHLAFLAYAPDGTLAWQYDHTGPTAITGYMEDMVVDAAGRIAATGFSITPAGDLDGFVLGMNGGAFAWQRTFGGSALLDDRAVSVALDSSGDVYVGAYLQDPDVGFDAFRYSPAGNLLAHGRLPVPSQGSGFARDLAVGANHRAYVVGDMGLFPVTNGDAVTAAFDFGTLIPTEFCFGDGTGTACPCGNAGAAGRGCANSSFAAGAALTRTGLASIGNDTLALTASAMTGPGLFFQANGLLASSAIFGDGLLCAGVGILRMGVVFPTSGMAAYPGGLTPNPIHLAGAPVSPGDLKHYQCWYRDTIAFCTSATFNLTQGLSIAWVQ